jgi:glycosyltransferase involved in cell wall biosynthesis
MSKVLVIIPAYNEESSIGRVIREVISCLPGANLLVVDDGSTDGTAREARQAGAMVLELPFNMGVGVAVQCGFIFAHSRGYRFVVRMDGDGQHRPSELSALLAPLEKGEADIVIGSRFVQSGMARPDKYIPGLTRRVGITFFSRLLGLLLGERVTDPSSGLQAMNLKAISFFAKEYPPYYPEVEARVLAHKAGLVVKEVPVTMLPRTGGISSITSLNSSYIVLEMLVSATVGMLRRIEK